MKSRNSRFGWTRRGLTVLLVTAAVLSVRPVPCSADAEIFYTNRLKATVGQEGGGFVDEVWFDYTGDGR